MGQPSQGISTSRHRVRGFSQGVVVLAMATATHACGASAVVVPPEGSEAGAVTALDDARGGRLYDKWYAELDVDFVPGSSGGPHGNGTLDDGHGRVMLDDGHGYRLKNLFGWDLRGADGIYGPRYQNKPYVRAIDLLSDERSPEALADWLERGDDDIPRMGDVLSRASIEEIAGFIVAVRSGALPRPDEIWALSETAPGHYVLASGASPERGATQIAERCGCHGATGLEIAIDEELSLGSYARMKGYEAWLKVLNGHPGSAMGRELDIGIGSGSAGSGQILDLLAALCDRNDWPPLTPEADVPDGDPRCGPYLR
jgi:hypothetical protein